MKTIVNAAPGVVDLGVQDLSIRPYSRAPEELPQHLPKYFIFAQSQQGKKRKSGSISWNT